MYLNKSACTEGKIEAELLNVVIYIISLSTVAMNNKKHSQNTDISTSVTFDLEL